MASMCAYGYEDVRERLGKLLQGIVIYIFKNLILVFRGNKNKFRIFKNLRFES
jgi:hypothetical protein